MIMKVLIFSMNQDQIYLLTTIDDVINWGRKNSLWPLTFATSCCGIEMMAAGAPRHDFARFGMEVYGPAPGRPM